MEISQLNEEKEAYEELKKEINKPLEAPEDKCNTFILYNIDNAKVIVNLIEKQQKEIDELKQLMAHKNAYTKKLEEDLYENASNYVISKDKIRDKIEELDNQQKQWLEDRKIKNSDGEIIFARDILKELLKEE